MGVLKGDKVLLNRAPNNGRGAKHRCVALFRYKQNFIDMTRCETAANAYNSSAQRATSSTGNNRNAVDYGERETTDSEENPPEKMNAPAQEHCCLSIKQAQNLYKKMLEIKDTYLF